MLLKHLGATLELDCTPARLTHFPLEFLALFSVPLRGRQVGTNQLEAEQQDEQFPVDTLL